VKLRLWPYESFIIETSEEIPELLRKLGPHMGSAPFFPWGKQNNEFIGTLNETGFKMYRAIRYNNSFLPIMIGQFEPRPGGTSVIVRMRLHGYTLVFMICFLVFLTKFSWDLIGPKFEFGVPFYWGLGVPATFILAIYLMTIFGFSYEADRSRELASKILTGKPFDHSLQVGR
jgi:hypothetical protein